MDITIPGYTLLRTLGKGGMATVYLAQQDMLERRVALKVMSRNLVEDSAFGERFMREAKIVSQLVHPNIVTVYEVGQHDGCYYLSMEYIDGHDLRTVRKNLDLNGKIRVIEDIARALHYAGEKGYVHRDIKPENIMFRQRDGSAVLTDFGIAKAVESDLTMTQTGTAIGTPHYMSPEQAKGKDVDQRSDLYSLGAVFFLLLSGRVPYDSESAVSIAVKHLTDPIPALPPQYPKLQGIIDGLMAKDPADRFQNGLVLLNQLREVDLDALEGDVDALDGQPTIAADLPTDFMDAASAKDDPRFTLEFEAVDTVIERPPRTILPTFFASLFILCSIFVFIYFARPSFLEHHIAVVEEQASRFAAWAQSHTERGVDAVASTAEVLKKEAEKTLEQIEPDAEPATSSENEKTDGPAHRSKDIAVTKSPASVSTSAPKDTTVAPDEHLANSRANHETAQEKAIKDLDEAADAIDIDAQSLPSSVSIPSLETLTLNLESLREKYRNSPDVEPDFIAAHYALLRYYPDDEVANASLAALQQKKRQIMLEAAEKGERDILDRQLTAYKALFQEGLGTDFSSFEAQLTTKLNIKRLLDTANYYEQNEQWFVPASSNAVTAYQTVLTMDEQNGVAQSRLAAIAEQTTLEAQQALRNGELEYAETLVNRALIAAPSSLDAKSLKAQIKSEADRLAKLSRSLGDAQKYADLGYLYTPEGANAYDAYKRVLQLAPGHTEAQSGMEALMDKLSVQVWDLVGEAKFDQAKEKLGRPLILMPNNKRLLAMLTAVEDVAAEQ